MKPTLTLANLDFEYELAAPAGYRPDPGVLRQCRRWQSVLRLLPRARQASTLDPLTLETSQTPERLVLWGVTARSAALAEKLGLAGDFPALEVVRQVNDKRFSHQLEQKLGIALPHSRIVESLEQLRAAVADCPYDWVLKHPFGASARERALGKRGILTESARGWALRKLDQSWTLLFEPWVAPRRDFSLHFEISPGQEPRFIGLCQLVSDPGGVYRGNRVIPSEPPDPEALRHARAVVADLAERGYHGPVGIDAFNGMLGGHACLRPLVEINARYSFGRLTLALGDWLPAGWSYLWWHPRMADAGSLTPSLTPLPEPGSQEPGAGVYALPLAVDPHQDSGTAVLIAPTPAALQQLEAGYGL